MDTKETTTPEELRHRIRVVTHAFLMCGLKYPQRIIFEDLAPQDFFNYGDYLRGDQVMGLKAEDEDGQKIISPGPKLVLSYEHQICKDMI